MSAEVLDDASEWPGWRTVDRLAAPADVRFVLIYRSEMGEFRLHDRKRPTEPIELNRSGELQTRHLIEMFNRIG